MNNDRSVKQHKVAVIGGGAAGCLAAAAAAENGAQVLLFEKNRRIGRKICATGGGRCNIANAVFNAGCYYSTGDFDPVRHLQAFPPEKLLAWFRAHGVLFHERNGYFYPRTDQAATIQSALEHILREEKAEILTGCTVQKVEKSRPGESGKFRILTAEGGTYTADALILACGGMAGPGFGASGDGYHFAEAFGHHVIDPLPALVQLRTADPVLRFANGVRTQASVSLCIGDTTVRTEQGELQIAGNTLSGIPVFQLSRLAARALHDHTEPVVLRVDFLPEIPDAEWKKETERRTAEARSENLTVAELFLGLVPAGIASMIAEGEGLTAENKCAKLSETQLQKLFSDLRSRAFVISGTNGFEDAQVTSGGIPLTELQEDGASKCCSGLYICGELTDVDGICGGYNLSYAMCTGYIAGKAAACCS